MPHRARRHPRPVRTAVRAVTLPAWPSGSASTPAELGSDGYAIVAETCLPPGERPRAVNTAPATRGLERSRQRMQWSPWARPKRLGRSRPTHVVVLDGNHGRSLEDERGPTLARHDPADDRGRSG